MKPSIDYLMRNNFYRCDHNYYCNTKCKVRLIEAGGFDVEYNGGVTHCADQEALEKYFAIHHLIRLGIEEDY